MVFGGGVVVDIRVWADGLATHNPVQYGELHLNFAGAARQQQILFAVFDAVTAALLLKGDTAGGTGLGVVSKYRSYFCTFNHATDELPRATSDLVPPMQQLFDSLNPANRAAVIKAVFRLAGQTTATMTWIVSTLSGVRERLKHVSNANARQAVEMLDEARPRRGMKRRTSLSHVCEIKSEAPHMVSVSSIQRSILLFRCRRAKWHTMARFLGVSNWRFVCLRRSCLGEERCERHDH